MRFLLYASICVVHGSGQASNAQNKDTTEPIMQISIILTCRMLADVCQGVTQAWVLELHSCTLPALHLRTL